MSNKNELAEKLEKLAHSIADDVLNPAEDISLEAKIMALQRLSAFYAMLNRTEADEIVPSNFGSYRNAIASSNADGTGSGTNGAKPGNGAERPYAITLDGEGHE